MSRSITVAAERAAAARLDRERSFHNDRYGDAGEDPRAALDRFYVATRRATALQEALVRREGTGRAVLEYGCADGTLALEEMHTPEFAARFDGIDLSDAAIARARKRAAALGLRNATFRAMDAEALDFPAARFDLVYGRGILHHLDLDRAFAEIARVLRPGGLAVFTEPMGHNPLLNLYRRLTPRLRTPDEHPLRVADFRLAARHFAQVEPRFFGLATLAAVPFRDGPLFAPVERLAAGIDHALLSLPVIGRQAWYVLLCCRK